MTQATIGGLQNGKRYTFRVDALNANGYGPARTGHSITVGTPIAPTLVSSRAAGSGMRVRWHAPAAKNGSPIAGYVVVPHLNGAALTPRRCGPEASAA